MTPTELNGETFLLLDNPPSWMRAVETTFEAQAETLRGLTGLEERESRAGGLRFTQSWSCWLDYAAGFTFAAAAQGFANQRLLAPFWPLLDDSIDELKATASHYLILRSPTPIVVASGDVAGTIVAGELVVPLFPARFVELPRPTADTDETMEVSFEVRYERDDFVTFDLTARTVATWGAAAGREPMVLDRPVNWRRGVQTGGAFVEIAEEQVGRGAAQSQTFFPQTPARGLALELDFTAIADALWLISLFRRAGGTTESFWSPTWRSNVRLAADVLAADEALTVESVDPLASDAIIALVSRTAALSIASVSGTTGATTINLDAPVGLDYEKDDTVVAPVGLFRFDRNSLTIQWGSTDEAKASLQLIETPREYAHPAGETVGTTVGPLGTLAYLYELTLEHTVPKLFRLTSFDLPVTDAEGRVWEPQAIQHRDIGADVNPERAELNIKARVWQGGPLDSFLRPHLEVAITARVLSVEGTTTEGVISWGTPSVLFVGTMSEARFQGPFVEARFASFAHLLERRFPTMLLQPTCGHALFSRPCGLKRSDWEARLTAVAKLTDSSITLAPERRPSGIGSIPEHALASSALTIFSKLAIGIYVNGVLEASGEIDASIIEAHGGGTGVGKQKGDSVLPGGFGMIGALDDLVISNAAFTRSQVREVMAGGLPHTGGTFWRYAFDGTLANALGSQAVTFGGWPGYTTDRNGVSGAALLFDESSNAFIYATGNDAIETELANPIASRTVATWLRPDSGIKQRVIYEEGTATAGLALYRTTGGAIGVRVMASGADVSFSTRVGAAPIATWSHVAVVIAPLPLALIGVADNTAEAAGELTVSLLDEFPDDLPVNARAVVAFGCDQSLARCVELGNRPRFGGFPFMPVGNPSMVKVKTSGGEGGKK